MKILGVYVTLLLFDFEDLVEVERVFARGSPRVRMLHLIRWILEVGFLSRGGLVRAKEMWVRVLGFLLHLWS